MYYKEEIKICLSHFSEKQVKKLHVFEIIRIIDKLMEKKIEDEEIQTLLFKIKECLETFRDGNMEKKKEYMALRNNLKKVLQTKYDLVAKGYFTGLYMAVGLSIGTGIGVALANSINVSFQAIGIGAGMSIGVAIGSSKEKEAEAKGLVY